MSKGHIQRHSRALILGCLVLSPVSAAQSKALDAEIRWTSFGVPHVKANDYASLGYGYGYATARDRLCLLTERAITLRGERAQWFGADGKGLVGFLPTSNINADLFHRVQLSDEAVSAALRKLTKPAREQARGYALGVNRFVAELPKDQRDAGCNGAPLPQMQTEDVVRSMMAIGTIWKGGHLGGNAEASAWGASSTKPQQKVDALPDTTSPLPEGIGSNAWAYGGDATKTAGAIVIANPHTRWHPQQWLLMHQVHLTIPGKLDVAGAAFVGLPSPVIGYNKDVAWSLEAPSTVTYFILQAMKVDETAATYQIGESTKKLNIRNIKLKVKQAYGSALEKSYPIAFSHLGPIYKLPDMPGRPAGWYAVTDAGDGNARGLDQMLAIARAESIKSFVSGVEENRGIGAHLIAGDRFGDALYIESGPLLGVSDKVLTDCKRAGERVAFNVLDGARADCSLRDARGKPLLAKPQELPALVTRGAIQNTNNSYHLSIHGQRVTGYSSLLGQPAHYDMRLPMSDKRLSEIRQDGQVTSDEALEIVFDNRNFAAETWLDDILGVCVDAKDNVAQGCAVLKDWDRRNEPDSRGALLFRELWPTIRAIPGIDAEPFDESQPLRARAMARTPEVKVLIASAIDAAVKKLASHKLTGGERWADVFARQTPGGRIAMHGGSGNEGVLNVMDAAPLGETGYADIVSGSAYIQRVTWPGGKVLGEVVLAHGQSSEPTSPQFADQLGLFANKRLIKQPFTEPEIAADPALTTLRLRQ